MGIAISGPLDRNSKPDDLMFGFVTRIGVNNSLLIINQEVKYLEQRLKQ